MEDAIPGGSASSATFAAASPSFPTAAATSLSATAKAEIALGRYAERLRIALTNAPTSVFEQDLDLKYTWIFNPKLGYAADEMIGRTDSELMDVAHAARIEAIKRQVIASGTFARERVPASAPRGPVAWYDLYVEPSRDEAGRVVGVICSATDITALLSAEAGLKASERRKAILLELGDALRLAGDPDGVLAAVAARLCAEIGGDRVVFAACDPLALVAADWRGGTVSREPDPCRLAELGPGFLAALAAGKAVVVHDVSVDPRTGSPEAQASFAARSIGAYVSTPVIRDGALAAVFTVYSSVARAWTACDIEIAREVAERAHTEIERLRAEAEARSQRALLAALFEQAPIAIGVIDTAGRFIVRNSRLDRYVAETMPSGDGRYADRWSLFDSSGRKVGPNDYPGAQALRGAPTAMEGKFRESDGRETWAHVSATPLNDEKGAITGAIAIITDIDQSKRAQEALRDSESRLRLALQGANAAAWQREIATGKIEFSAEAESVFDRAEWAPRTFDDFLMRIHPDDRARTLAVMRDASRNRRPYIRVEYRILLPNGRSKSLLTLSKAEFDVVGAPVRLSGIVVDVTGQKTAEAALRESESRLRLALQGANAAAWQREIATGKIQFSPEAASIYERADYGPPNFDEWLERIHPDDRASTLAVLDEVKQHRHPEQRVEYRLLFPDGRIKWVLSLGKVAFNGNGVPVRISGILMDVTEQKKAEAALRESEERLRFALQGARAVAFERDFRSGKLRYVPEDNALFESPGGPADGAAWLQAVHPEDREHVGALLHEIVERQLTHWRSEYRLLFPDGRVKWVLALGKAMFDENGAPVRLQGINLDVTAEKLAGAALRESEDRLRIALQVARAVAFERDFRSGTLHYEPSGNALFESPSGVPADGAAWLQVIHPEDREHVGALLSNFLEKKRTHWRWEFRLLFPDGRVKWVLSVGQPMVDAHGATFGVRGIHMDVTPERLAREALRRSEKELKALNAELAERVEREVQARQSAQAKLAQSEKMAALGQLAGGIAHDFNNVLQTVLIGAASIQRRPDDLSLVKPFAARIEEAARRGAAITGRLLAFARRDEMNREAVDIGSVLTELTAMLKPTLAPGVRFVVEIAQDLPKAATDRHQLEAALVNLATNAADAIDGEGRITFSAREERALDRDGRGLEPGSYVRIDVQDTGAGMDEETLSHMFEPFFTTKEIGKGTGLGLPTTRSFAKRSGGGVSITSRLGEGTTASLWLPVAALEEASASLAAPPHFDAGKPTRVLVVDDERLLREMLALELSDHGFAVDTAESGAEGLARLDGGARYDVIISDLSMPKMTGVTFLNEARRRVPDVPAIILTGNAGAVYAEDLEESIGARVSLVRKPISGVALAAAIADLIRPPPD